MDRKTKNGGEVDAYSYIQQVGMFPVENVEK